MEQKISYILSEYYRHYAAHYGHPHLSSKRVGLECSDPNTNHEACCSLDKLHFSWLCRIVDIPKTCDITTFLCFKKRVVGNDGIRSGRFERPPNIRAKTVWLIKFSIMSTFTDQFAKKPTLLISLINVIRKFDISNDFPAQEFIRKYMASGMYISCDDELGTMISQTFTKYAKNEEKITRLVNIDELNKLFNSHIQNKYSSKNLSGYTTCR